MRISTKNLFWILLVGVLLVLSAETTHAQSGRRQKTPEPAAPIPTPTPEPTPTPRAEQKEPELIFLVGVDRSGAFNFYPDSFYDAVVTGCAAALRNSSAGVDVSRDLPRGDAIKKAKNDTKTYVVVLELKAENMNGSSSNTTYDQIDVSYMVFAPGTAKVATSGRTYQNANRRGPVVIGPPTTGGTTGLYREALLQRAAEDAGVRILKALHLYVPVIH